VLLGLSLAVPAARPTSLAEAADPAPTAINPYGGQIEIAVTGDAESDPAVALCASNQYLAVYRRGGDIFGQRLTTSGELLGSAFLVSGGGLASSNPDLACEWSTDTFVVVWEAEYLPSDHDIQAQGVHGAHQSSGSQLRGAIIDVIASNLDERNPALACNSDDQTCLAVYEREDGGDTYIHGRRIEVSASAPVLTVPFAAIEISTLSTESNPDVAWAGSDDQFAVVWQHWQEGLVPPGPHLLIYRLMWDTHQAGIQWQQPDYGLIYGTCGWSHDQAEPAIAFSRGAEEYLVAFQYDRSGDGANHDIAALRLYPDGSRFCPFYLDETGFDERAPTVAYSGGPEHMTDRHGNPQFLVAYSREEPGTTVLYAQGVKDRDDAFGFQLDGDAQELDRVPSHPGGGITAPDVTGSAYSGRYLVAWQRNPAADILGHLAAPYGGVFSIAGTSFVPADSAVSYDYRSWGGISLTSPGTAYPLSLAASVELPEGATITSLRLYYQDSEPTADIWLDLMRFDGAGGADSMASVISSTDGTSSKTETSISDAVVDPANYSYLLSVIFEGPDLILYGVEITYIPNASAPRGPFSVVAPSPDGDKAVAVLDSGLPGEEAAPVLHSGGRVTLLGLPDGGEGDGGGERERAVRVGSEPTHPAASGPRSPVSSGGVFDWRRYTVPGSGFHPLFSDTEFGWTFGGGRHVVAAPTLPSLVAPLNLIHGKTIRRARFTYYDVSAENPAMYLYRVSRQGTPGSAILWSYEPEADGGYFVATSPRLDHVVDNHSFAYYFVAQLGNSVAGSDLRAMEIEISYICETYLPVVFKLP
jgi:hypothetical protein